jgi:hypothetical protein
MITFISWGTPIMGGVQNLILNISQELNVKGLKAKIFGFKSCLIYKELVRLKVDFVFIDLMEVNEQDLSKHLTEEDVIVFGSYSPRFRLWMFERANPRILYWNVFANKLAIANRASKFFNLKFRTKELIKQMTDNDSVVYMDVHGLKAIDESIGAGLVSYDEDRYLPIPVKTLNNQNVYLEKKTNEKKTEINVTYVGRSSVWKMQPLKKIVADLASLKLAVKINVHIISQQPEDYRNFIADVKLHDNMNIEYHDSLIGEEYRDFLVRRSDIHFAMGTSALDGAVLGIPTIVMDYSSSEFPADYKYLWLFDAVGYDLGHPVDKFNVENSNSLESIISLIEDNGEKINLISKKTYDYVHSNHEISAVVDKLLIFASKAKLRVRTVLKYTLINSKLIKFGLKLMGKDVMQIYKT